MYQILSAKWVKLASLISETYTNTNTQSCKILPIYPCLATLSYRLRTIITIIWSQWIPRDYTPKSSFNFQKTYSLGHFSSLRFFAKQFSSLKLLDSLLKVIYWPGVANWDTYFSLVSFSLLMCFLGRLHAYCTSMPSCMKTYINHYNTLYTY